MSRKTNDLPTGLALKKYRSDKFSEYYSLLKVRCPVKQSGTVLVHSNEVFEIIQNIVAHQFQCFGGIGCEQSECAF